MAYSTVGATQQWSRHHGAGKRLARRDWNRGREWHHVCDYCAPRSSQMRRSEHKLIVQHALREEPVRFPQPRKTALRMKREFRGQPRTIAAAHAGGKGWGFQLHLILG